MSKKPETVFKEKVLPLLRALPKSWFEKIQQKSIRGTPDIMGCLNGFFIGIELKKDCKSKVDTLQLYKLEQIGKADGIGIVVTPENWEKVYGAFKKFVKGV